MIPISLTILLLFLIQIFSQIICMNPQNLANAHNDEIRDHLNRYQQNVNRGNLAGANKLFSNGAKILLQDDGSNVSPKQFNEILIRNRPWGINYNDASFLGISNSPRKFVSFSSSNREHNMQTALEIAFLRNGDLKIMGGQHEAHLRAQTTPEPFYGAPSSSADRTSSYFEPSGGSEGSGKSSKNSNDRGRG